MPVTYELASEAGNEAVFEAMRLYHGRLRDADLAVDVVMAVAPRDDQGEPTGEPAVKVHGVKALASVRVIGLKDRAKGMGDAEILIDRDEWETMGASSRLALIDHELTHIELATDKNGNVKRDDLGRPKLAIRPHDREFGWFDEVAQRHGTASVESLQYKRLASDDFVKSHYAS